MSLSLMTKSARGMTMTLSGMISLIAMTWTPKLLMRSSSLSVFPMNRSGGAISWMVMPLTEGQVFEDVGRAQPEGRPDSHVLLGIDDLGRPDGLEDLGVVLGQGLGQDLRAPSSWR